MSNLISFQNGMQPNVNGEDITVYGYLLAILADTPAAGFMAGMKQSPGSARKGCCTCTINAQEMQIKLDIAMLEERCPNLHRQRCNDLETMPQRLKSVGNKWYFTITEATIFQHFTWHAS